MDIRENIILAISEHHSGDAAEATLIADAVMKEIVKTFNLVADMRQAQKEYFRTKKKQWLVKSKTLESQVDHELKKFVKPELQF